MVISLTCCEKKLSREHFEVFFSYFPTNKADISCKLETLLEMDKMPVLLSTSFRKS